MPQTRNVREVLDASNILLQMSGSDRDQSSQRVPAAGPEDNATRGTNAAVNYAPDGNPRANTRAPVQATAMPKTDQTRAQPAAVRQQSHHRAQSAPATNSIQSRAQRPVSGRATPMQPPGQLASTSNANQGAPQMAPPEQRLVPMNANQSLQAYLLHQQRIAGIAPQDMITIPDQHTGQSQSRNQRIPSLVRFTRQGSVEFPSVPPARFDGVLLPPLLSANQASGASQSARYGVSTDPARYAIGKVAQPVGDSIGQDGGDVDGSSGSNDHANVHTGQGNGTTDQQEHQPSSNQLPRLQNLDKASASGPSTTPGNVSASQDTIRYSRYMDIPSALTSFPQLLTRIIDELEVDDFLNLYAASKRFHFYVRANPQSTITYTAFRRFTESARIFAHPCYRKFTIYVRSPRPGTRPGETLPGQVMDMRPSTRWLKMLEYRDNVVKEIMQLFGSSGYALSARCESVLKKIWFLMDIPDNRRRIFAIQNRHVWSNLEIFYGIFILAHIESRFTKNVSNTPREGVRRLLMGQKGLTLLRDALKGTALSTHYDMLREYIRWKYVPTPDETNMFIFGMPAGEHGLLQYEYYGRTGSKVKLQRPDDLLLRESVRRQLDMQNMYAWFYLQSEIDPSLKRDYQLEPEATFLQVMLYEAKKNHNNPLNWWKEAVVDE